MLRNCQLIAKVARERLPNVRHSSMLAWKVNPHPEGQLELQETKLPTLSSPWDLLVKVHSTSVNPLDVRMIRGYGRRLLDLLHLATNFEPRITNDRYPLTLGRDFSGEVMAVGPCSANRYKIGDLVCGAVEPQRSGSHAQYVAVPSYCLTKKPENLSHNEASTIPFAALTAYSALSTFGRLDKNNCHNKQVLVIGGSGGVGSFAIQLLKLWGANVTATCSEEKSEWLEETLFVDQAVNHHDRLQMDLLKGKFDFVLDCGNYDSVSLSHQDIVASSLEYLKPYNQGVYVTLSPPILSNTDEQGMVVGGVKTAFDIACDTIRGLSNLNSARWAVFLPNKWALDYVTSLYKDEAIAPQLSSVFNFDQLPDAYEDLQSGKVRGKVVVDVTKLGSEKPASNSGSGSAGSDSCPVSERRAKAVAAGTQLDDITMICSEVSTCAVSTGDSSFSPFAESRLII